MKKRLFFFLSFLIMALATFLRLKNITSSPPSPYWEEVALAYDAYSILETGKDHHGNAWPIVAFESFGDWKPSLYFYVLIPFIKIFGLNLLAIRLPSVLAGLALALGAAVFTKLLTKKILKKNSSETLFLLVLFIAAISPWGNTFSRAAWETNLASALIIWGINSFLFFIKKAPRKKGLAILSVFLLILATYCYHAARIIAPLLGLGLVLLYIFEQKKKSNWRFLLVLTVLALFSIAPLLKSLGSSVGQQRFMETSIFNDLSVIERSNQLKAEAGNSFWSRIVYHRYLLFGKEILLNFFDHFSFRYLFLSGDTNPRHSIQSFGEFYVFEGLFFLLGLIFIIKNWQAKLAFLLAYLAIAILPATLTKTTPHALRTLSALPAFLSLISLGIWQFLSFFKKEEVKNIILILIVSIYLFFTFNFWQDLNLLYPKQYSSEWQYGYGEMISEVASRSADYEQIYITREQGRPAMYYWFYTKTDPRVVQDLENIAKKDQGEFLEFKNIKFVNGAGEIGRGLVASSQKVFNDLKSQKEIKELATVKNLANEVIWKVYEISEK